MYYIMRKIRGTKRWWCDWRIYTAGPTFERTSICACNCMHATQQMSFLAFNLFCFLHPPVPRFHQVNYLHKVFCDHQFPALFFFFNEYFLHKFGQSLPFIPYKISCTNYYFYCDELNLALDVFANSRSWAVSTEQTILLPFTKDVFVNFSTNASCTSRIQTLRQGGWNTQPLDLHSVVVLHTMIITQGWGNL